MIYIARKIRFLRFEEGRAKENGAGPSVEVGK